MTRATIRIDANTSTARAQLSQLGSQLRATIGEVSGLARNVPLIGADTDAFSNLRTTLAAAKKDIEQLSGIELGSMNSEQLDKTEADLKRIRQEIELLQEPVAINVDAETFKNAVLQFESRLSSLNFFSSDATRDAVAEARKFGNILKTEIESALNDGRPLTDSLVGNLGAFEALIAKIKEVKKAAKGVSGEKLEPFKEQLKDPVAQFGSTVQFDALNADFAGLSPTVTKLSARVQELKTGMDVASKEVGVDVKKIIEAYKDFVDDTAPSGIIKLKNQEKLGLTALNEKTGKTEDVKTATEFFERARKGFEKEASLIAVAISATTAELRSAEHAWAKTGNASGEAADKVTRLRKNLVALENASGQTQSAIRDASKNIDALNLTVGEKFLQDLEQSGLAKESRVYTYLDRAFNSFSEFSSTLGSLTGSAALSGPVSDMIDLVGSFPELTGQFKKFTAALAATSLNIVSAKGVIGSIGGAITAFIVKLTGFSAAVVASGIVVGAVAAIGVVIISILGTIDKANKQAELLAKNARRFAEGQKFLAEGMSSASLTIAEANKNIKDSVIQQSFLDSAIKRLEAFRQSQQNGIEMLYEGVDKEAYNLARLLGNDGLGEVILEVKDSVLELKDAALNTQIAIDRGIASRNSLLEFFGEFGKKVREINPGDTFAEIEAIIEAGGAVEDLAAAHERYSAALEEAQQSVIDITNAVSTAVRSFNEQQASITNAYKVGVNDRTKTAYVARTRAKEDDTFQNQRDKRLEDLRKFYDDLDAALAGDGGGGGGDNMSKKLKDAADDLAKQLAKLAEDAAEAIAKFNKDSLERQTEFDIKRLRAIEDFERKRFEIEETYQESRYAAILDNDVRSFLDAGRTRSKSLRDASYDFNTDSSRSLEDFNRESVKRKEALDERLADIEKERQAAILASQQRVDEIKKEVTATGAAYAVSREEKLRREKEFSDLEALYDLKAQIIKRQREKTDLKQSEDAAKAQHDKEQAQLLKTHLATMLRLGTEYLSARLAEFTAQRGLSTVKDLAAETTAKIDIYTQAILAQNDAALLAADATIRLAGELREAQLLMEQMGISPEQVQQMESSLPWWQQALDQVPYVPAPKYGPQMMPNDGSGRESRANVTLPLTVNVGSVVSEDEARRIAMSIADQAKAEIIAMISRATGGR